MNVVHSFENIRSATRIQIVTIHSATTFTNCLPIGEKISEEVSIIVTFIVTNCN
jgi:hypothetical protein